MQGQIPPLFQMTMKVQAQTIFLPQQKGQGNSTIQMKKMQTLCQVKQNPQEGQRGQVPRRCQHLILCNSASFNVGPSKAEENVMESAAKKTKATGPKPKRQSTHTVYVIYKKPSMFINPNEEEEDAPQPVKKKSKIMADAMPKRTTRGQSKAQDKSKGKSELFHPPRKGELPMLLQFLCI